MKAKIQSTFDCSLQTFSRNAVKSVVHSYICKPLFKFIPHKGVTLPKIFTKGEYAVKMYLFGFIPMGNHYIKPEEIIVTDEEFKVRDNGRGSIAKTWDHWFYASKVEGENKIIYADEVTIKAGLFTPIVYAIAVVFYSWRQRRWKKLIKSGFKQIN